MIDIALEQFWWETRYRKDLFSLKVLDLCEPLPKQNLFSKCYLQFIYKYLPVLNTC